MRMIEKINLKQKVNSISELFTYLRVGTLTTSRK